MFKTVEISERNAREGLARGIGGLEFRPTGMRITRTDGVVVDVSHTQLSVDAPDRFDPRSGQRLGPATGVSDRIETVVARADGVDVVFQDGDRRAWSYEALACFAQKKFPGDRVRLWRDGMARARFSVTRFLEDDDESRRALSAVARDGVCLLGGDAAAAGDIETIVRRFGYVRETNYGRIFDVRVSAHANNLAFTDLGLAPHTDNPYRDPPPSVQVLQCIEAAGAGGETLLVDGFAAVEDLRAANAEAFAVLAETPVGFVWHDRETRLEALAPVIDLDRDGRVRALRVNDRALALQSLSGDVCDRWRHAYAQLCAIIGAASNQRKLTLNAGDTLIMDNRRILHGRTAYAGTARWLQGCYADMDALLSRLAVLEEAEARARVQAALAPLSGPAGDAHYGEGVSLRAHALQAAECAARNGLGPSMTAAALLHDIGWALGEPHETTGADLIERLFGAQVAAPVRAHVAAKRYLVACEPDYVSRLSDASRQTLVHQGGPMSPAEAQDFRATPGFELALALRRLDDEAKDAASETVDIDAYRGLLFDLALSALRTEYT